jgi:hypothetical protein
MLLSAIDMALKVLCGSYFKDSQEIALADKTVRRKISDISIFQKTFLIS